jgi:hypothetical protein
MTLLFRSSLLTDLMSVIDNNIQLRCSSQVVDPRNTLMLRRSIKVLTEVLKEFLGYKMLAGVRTMGNVCDYYHNAAIGDSRKTSWLNIFTNRYMTTTREYRQHLHLHWIPLQSVSHEQQVICYLPIWSINVSSSYPFGCGRAWTKATLNGYDHG